MICREYLDNFLAFLLYNLLLTTKNHLLTITVNSFSLIMNH